MVLWLATSIAERVPSSAAFGPNIHHMLAGYIHHRDITKPLVEADRMRFMTELFDGFFPTELFCDNTRLECSSEFDGRADHRPIFV